MDEHKSGLIPGFTKQYDVHQLVYFEEFKDIRDAITREKKIKRMGKKVEIRIGWVRKPGMERFN